MNKHAHTTTLYLLGLFFVLLAASCSPPSLDEVKTKADYIKRVSALSENKLQKTLKTDLDSLTSLKEDLDAFNIYIGFGMSIEDGSGKKAELKPDSVFKINTDFNSIKNSINGYSKSLNFTQTPELPNSTFEVSPNEELSTISANDIDVKLKKLYVGAQAYTEDKIGMKMVDSIAVDFNYEFPKSFEAFKFNPKGKKEISYHKQVIELDSTGDESIEFDAPISLYKDMLSYQALSPSGVLMNSSSHSAMPLTTIKSAVRNDLTSVLQILKTAQQLKNKEAVIKALNNLPVSIFPAIAKYHSFNAKFKSLQNDKSLKGFEAIKRLKEIMAENKDLFGMEKQRISLKFPDKIGELILYMARDKEKITGSAIARAHNTVVPYKTYFDRQTHQYGVIDSNYAIVIPASQPQLELTDNSGLYYINRKENQAFHLDISNKKLTPLKKGYKYVKPISERLTIFADSNDYVGVLENNDKIVIPFEYDKIEKTGNVLLLTKSKRGRKKREIRSLDNKLITDLKDLTITPYPDYGVFIIENDKEKFGMIDKNGKTAISPTYHALEPIDKEPLLMYIEDANSNLKGVMKEDQTKVTKPEFIHLDGFQEGFAVYRTDDINNAYGYLNKAGQPVFGRHSAAYAFAGGYALVFDNNIFSLIDNSGKKIKQIPYKTLSEPGISLSGKNTIYEIDGKKYNYAGQPVN